MSKDSRIYVKRLKDSKGNKYNLRFNSEAQCPSLYSGGEEGEIGKL